MMVFFVLDLKSCATDGISVQNCKLLCNRPTVTKTMPMAPADFFFFFFFFYRNGHVACYYFFSPYVIRNMLNLRNAHVAVPNLVVQARYVHTWNCLPHRTLGLSTR